MNHYTNTAHQIEKNPEPSQNDEIEIDQQEVTDKESNNDIDSENKLAAKQNKKPLTKAQKKVLEAEEKLKQAQAELEKEQEEIRQKNVQEIIKILEKKKLLDIPVEEWKKNIKDISLLLQA